MSEFELEEEKIDLKDANTFKLKHLRVDSY